MAKKGCKVKTVKIIFEECANEYIKNSSIHGFPYLESSRQIGIRLTWYLLLSISACLFFFVDKSLSENWSNNPIATNTETTEYPIQKIPFPAVTVCPNALDPWAPIERIGNNLSMAGNWELLEPFWNATRHGLRSNWFLLEGPMMISLNFGFECMDASFAYNVVKALECINVYLLFFVYSSNATHGWQLTEDLWTKVMPNHFGKSASDNNYILMHDAIHTILREEIESKGIECRHCFIWMDKKEGYIIEQAIVSYARHLGNVIVDDKTWWAVFERKESHAAVTIADKIHAFRLSWKFTRLDMVFPGTLLTAELQGNIEKINHVFPTEDMTNLQPAHLANFLLSLTTASSARHKALDENNVTLDCLSIGLRPTSGSRCNFRDYKSLLNFMKETVPSAHMLDIGTFPNIVNQSDSDKLEKVSSFSPAIPYCQLASSWSKGPGGFKEFDEESPFKNMCTLFQPTLTDQGICHTFNRINPSNKLQRSSYMSTFEQVFQDSSSTEASWRANGIRIKNGVRFILDAHVMDGMYKLLPNHDNTFQIAIQHPKDFPLPLTSGMKVEGGHWYSISVDPQLVRSSKDIITVPTNKRPCKFPEETSANTTSFFLQFELRACFFECMLEAATKSCGCTPWNYPQKDDNNNVICAAKGNVCFTSALKSSRQSCQCHGNCQETKYDFDINSEQLEESHCESEEPMFQKIRHYIDQYQTRPRLKEFWGNFSHVYRGTGITFPKFSCKDRLTNDIVVLDIYYSKPFVKKLKRSIAATFSDKLASIGGTLGLFCGMSLLSVAEIIICIFRTLHGVVARN